MMGKNVSISSGQRKYTPIWQQCKVSGECTITVDSVQDSLTVINGVKKEKSKDRSKPQGKELDISTEQLKNSDKIKITFKLVTAFRWSNFAV